MPSPVLVEQFQLPIWFDLAATALGALTGALVAHRRNYDVFGLLALALVSGAGGGLLRDVIISNGPPVLLTDVRLLIAVLIGAGIGLLFEKRTLRYKRLHATADNLSLAVYAVVGAQKGIEAGLSPLGVIFIGTANAIGGGILRDVLVREEVQLLKPGQYYGLIGILSSALFETLTLRMHGKATVAALVAIPIGFSLRALSMRYDWQTRPVHPPAPDET